MTQTLHHLITVGRKTLFWTLAALPFSPSIAALILFGPDCYRPEQPGDISSGSCLVNLTVMAPLGVAFGGLSSDEDPRAILGPATVMTALLLGALGATLQLTWRRRKAT